MNLIIFLNFIVLLSMHQFVLGDVVVFGINRYLLFKGINGLCPLTDGRNKDNNGKLVMYNACYVSTYNAWWKTIAYNSGMYTLVNHESGLCLTAGKDLNDSGNNAEVLQYACQNPPSSSQLFSYEVITHNHVDYLRIKGSSGRCVSYDPAGTGIMGALYMYDCGCCDRYTNQFFVASTYNF